MSFNVNKIRELLKIKKITQREIADRINMSQAGFNNALSSGDFKATVLDKIAKELGVPVGFFFDEVPGGVGNINAINNGQIGGSVQIQLDRKQSEIEQLKIKLSACEEQLKLKDEIISLLKNK